MTDQDKEIFETELFNKVLLNRIEQKRDEIKELKTKIYALKTENKQQQKQLENQSGPQLIKEVFAFVGMISIALFVIIGIYKAIL
tara:strand:- start:422 stop:676 length:255 start_codon:yes stop_codon:yes gene_type:complete